MSADVLPSPLKMETIFSPCRKYRYTLWRSWNLPQGLPYGRMGESGFEPLPLKGRQEFAMFIGLNPSTADETQDDPTIRRCIDFAKRWGYGALCMANLFAYRATQPKDMMTTQEPIGVENDKCLIYLAKHAGIVICAWGNGGNFMGRGVLTRDRLREAGVKRHHLGLNSDRTPKHPLYLSKTTTPIPYET